MIKYQRLDEDCNVVSNDEFSPISVQTAFGNVEQGAGLERLGIFEGLDAGNREEREREEREKFLLAIEGLDVNEKVTESLEEYANVLAVYIETLDTVGRGELARVDYYIDRLQELYAEFEAIMDEERRKYMESREMS